MEFLSTIWNEALIRPLFNALVWLYNVVPFHDLGAAIIILTIVVRVVLTPLFWKAQKSQRELALIQPEIKKIQERHKDDREAQSRALMELYRTRGVNPFSGCILGLLQAPILIALYWVFLHIFDEGRLAPGFLYSFVVHPGFLDPIAFGFLDLSAHNLYFGAVAAAVQFLQLKLAAPPKPPPSSGKADFSQMMQMQMQYVFPFLILYLSYIFPAAPILYWTVFNIIAILQEIIMRRYAVTARSA